MVPHNKQHAQAQNLPSMFFFGVSASRSATLSYVFWLDMGMGWGGFGDDDVPCTLIHLWCYGQLGWGGVGWGWGWWRSLHINTSLMLRTTGVGWGGVGVGWGWGWWRSLHINTSLMLRTTGVGWGGVGDDDVPCTLIHLWCYGQLGWGGVGDGAS